MRKIRSILLTVVLSLATFCSAFTVPVSAKTTVDPTLAVPPAFTSSAYVILNPTDPSYVAPHEHSYSYSSNGDGTHTGSCSCGDTTASEDCSPASESGDVCGKCGYTTP